MDTLYNKYSQAALNIVSEQKQIIGPLALEMAKRVENIKSIDNLGVEITGDPIKMLERLVQQYEVLFGETSVKVSKNSIKSIPFSPTELPEILR